MTADPSPTASAFWSLHYRSTATGHHSEIVQFTTLPARCARRRYSPESSLQTASSPPPAAARAIMSERDAIHFALGLGRHSTRPARLPTQRIIGENRRALPRRSGSNRDECRCPPSALLSVAIAVRSRNACAERRRYALKLAIAEGCASVGPLSPRPGLWKRRGAQDHGHHAAAGQHVVPCRRRQMTTSPLRHR